VRYPGHRDIMNLLLQDLRLHERRDLLGQILRHAVPSTRQDVVLVFVTATGYREGRLVQESFTRKVYGRAYDSRRWSAIQVTTASAVCAVLDLVSQGVIQGSGLVRQEEIALDAFLSNRFGSVYAMEAAPRLAA
jgi:saccharopine dehydrogenase-like NADP-dependent oxidoreductase